MSGRQVHSGTFWNPWRLGGWGLALGLLLLPAIAMQFTGEVQWTLSDFLVAAMMLAILGLGIELTVRVTRNSLHRAGAAVALLSGFLVIWINGAVGIIGNEDHPANLMFFGVIALAIAGSFICRFRARGMARNMAMTGLAQLTAPLIAIAIWSLPVTVDLVKTLIFNAGLAGFWLASAWLFRQAAESGEPLINVN